MFRSIWMLAALIALTMQNECGAQDQWYEETLYPEWKQVVRMDKVFMQEKTGLQDLVIFENGLLGRVLGLDGVVQTTEADEYVYHEMMVHVPLISHANPEQVLIIGGGDGGILREVIRHRTVKKVVMVEIDKAVVDLSKEHLPSLSNGAFDDSRLELIIDDGAKFVKETQDRFDVIICDSTDPIGPGEVLFTQEFYGDCKNILRKGGIFVNQNGVPFLQSSEVKDTYQRRLPHFKDVGFYIAAIPSYFGGFMALGWATDEASYRHLSLEVIQERLQRIDGELKYYNAEIHRACFALPNFIKQQYLEDKVVGK
jgi:spermidine synthase